MSSQFPASVLQLFEQHVFDTKQHARKRRAALQPRSVVDDNAATKSLENDVEATLGQQQPTDKWQGCANLRTLRTLLSRIDDRGFERSPHQLQFHNAFERCTARVMYKQDWAAQESYIVEHNGWDRCSSEVMISTPRRFGKTFRCGAHACVHSMLLALEYSPTQCVVCSIAIYCACMALSFGCEIVVFSPARRASRKLLERMVE